MALSFIFDASKETPASVAKQRAIVEALMSSQSTPRNLGEGLNALGDGIVMNVLNRRADTAEQAGQAGAKSTFGDLLNAGTFPAAPIAQSVPGAGSTAAPASPRADNPNLPSSMDFAQAQAAPSAATPVDLSGATGNMTAFTNSMYKAGLASGLTDTQARLMAAQAAHESGNGAHAPGNNFFGIKAGKSWNGDTQNLWTHEEVNGQNVRVKQNFRKYGDPGQAIQDRIAFMQKNFPDAFNAPDISGAIAGLQHGRFGSYATDSQYAQKLQPYLSAITGGDSVPPAVAAVNAEATGQPVQVASLDPSAGMGGGPRPMPPEYASNGMTQEQWDAMNRPGDDLAPMATAPAPAPQTGSSGVVQALSAANQPATAAAAAPSPVVQALASAQQPQQAAPVSPSVQKVAQALAPQQQAADNLPVIAGGTADAIQPGQAGPSVQQIMQVAADPWASPEQKAMANMMLQQRMQEQDPLRQLQIQAARKSLAAPPKQWQKLDDNTLFDPTSGETKAINGVTSGDVFDGKSVEGQSLNWLIKNGKLTPEQAAQVGAGKTITGPNGEIIFMTPQGVFGQDAGGGPAQPVTPAPVPQASPAQGVPPAATPLTAPAAPGTVAPPAATRPGMIPLTDPKSLKKPPNEAQQRNQQLYTVVKPEVERIDQTFGAMSDPSNQLWSNLPVGADYATTQEYQQAANSLRTVVASYLYSVSGATATPGEVENLSATLIPRVGEKKPSIDDKLARIHTMVEAIKNNRGEVQDEAPAGSKKTSTGIDWSIEQ
ncbi:MAG: hypothetical protein E5Y04_28740 [Mesorhizobium sp.]|nr:MAG: hypothetical protein E5Y04_28740 [Mesorhizobium sp.]